MTSAPSGATRASRETFSSRSVFVFAAIGSAVGLGNIWRFPYVAFENGGGAFLVPYIVALITAGIPLLFFDYSIGHRFRGSAPLAYRRLNRGLEPVGWFQVGISVVIAVYYAVIVGWSAWYAYFSLDKRWGSGLDEATTFFTQDFLNMSENSFGMTFVWRITIMLAVIWILATVILALGVQKGIGRLNQFFIPLLVVLFIILVVFALLQDGAMDGLNRFFTPNWGVLTDPKVWIAAYGQIFFSLSVGFGIMTTYASYLKRRSNLTTNGLLVGFSNSAFEVLAGIGVFAALGFLIASSPNEMTWDDVSGGVGLAFFTFPALISEMSGGSIFGLLFFGCLVLAGLTSLISIIEVVIASVRDKLPVSRVTGTLIVCIPLAIISMLLMPTTTGLMTLDILDAFSNQIGIVAGALLSIVGVALAGKLIQQRDHLNAVSSWRVGNVWFIFLGLTTVALTIMIIDTIRGFIAEPYEGYDLKAINVWGWGMLGVLILLAIILTMTPWKRGLQLTGEPPENKAIHANPRNGKPAESLANAQAQTSVPAGDRVDPANKTQA